MLGILSLWREMPMFFAKGLQKTEEIEGWVLAAVKIWEAPVDISVKISTANCMQKITEVTFAMPASDTDHALMFNVVKSAL